MKIAWFTPFSKSSAIARFSSLVVDELVKSAEVDLWHPASDDLRETAVPHHRIELLNRANSNELPSYDALVYNFGNNLEGHREIFELARRSPGICILHDYVMQNFFANLYLRYSNNRRLYTAAMARHYGERGELVALDSVSEMDPIWCSDDVVNYPLFEEAIAGAFGVVVHSEFFRQRVEQVYAGPLMKLFLPYALSSSGVPASKQALGLPLDRKLAITIGHVNPNKRIDCVIRALAQDPELRRKVVYVVAGSTASEYADTLKSLTANLHLEESVVFTGQLSDVALHAYLTHADVCINLRYPTIEGSSASLVEEMLHRKPVIVSDAGFYGELPDSCVLKIPPALEERDLAPALRKLIDSEDAREYYSQNAFDHASRHFRADLYAEGLLELIAQSRRAKPLLQLSDAIGAELQQMGVTGDMAIVQTSSDLMYEIYGKGPSLLP